MNKVGQIIRWRRSWIRGSDGTVAGLEVDECDPPWPNWVPVPKTAYRVQAEEGEFVFAYVLTEEVMERVVADETFQSYVLTFRFAQQTKGRESVRFDHVLKPAAYFETEREALLFRLMF